MSFPEEFPDRPLQFVRLGLVLSGICGQRRCGLGIKLKKNGGRVMKLVNRASAMIQETSFVLIVVLFLLLGRNSAITTKSRTYEEDRNCRYSEHSSDGRNTRI